MYHHILFFELPNLQKASFGGVFGASFGESRGVLCSLGASWANLGRVCARLWVRLGVSEGILETSSPHLGVSWEDLGGFKGVLEAFQEHFGSIFEGFSAISSNL